MIQTVLCTNTIDLTQPLRCWKPLTVDLMGSPPELQFAIEAEFSGL